MEEDLEKSGPFHPAFQSDTKKVWATLHALFGTTSAWAHVKTLGKSQNGRQAFRILHKHFFGGNKVSMMATTVLSNLRNLTYTSDSKNYNFDKYVTNHVQQHNLAHFSSSTGLHLLPKPTRSTTSCRASSALILTQRRPASTLELTALPTLILLRTTSLNSEVCNRPGHLPEPPIMSPPLGAGVATGGAAVVVVTADETKARLERLGLLTLARRASLVKRTWTNVPTSRPSDTLLTNTRTSHLLRSNDIGN